MAAWSNAQAEATVARTLELDTRWDTPNRAIRAVADENAES